ncbi:MAG: hypothetical protein IJ486_06885, partial [Firmicutes bacterium]|nr:hypothetical protein [Bacillota bacterium]
TNGQFTGVHKSRQSGTLYYQSFAVQGEIVLFEVSEGTIEERVLIEDAELPEETPEEEEPEEASVVEMEVGLSLPSVTYVGHPVTATDTTGFTVDGEWRSATRVYAEGLAANRFRLPDGGGTIKKSKSVPTKAEAVFDTVGTHSVSLTVTESGGGTGTDIKSINVLKTPTILHSLSGTQKQNRAQTLNVWVATDPERSLETMWIEIKDAITGETVRLDHHVDGTAENTLKNNDTIKTRPIEALESDELFTNCRLEFLTKNEEEQEFVYTIYVKDSGGRVDQVTESFTVMPDLAPDAHIQMEDTFLREESSDQAVIETADGSQTDGDQLERCWSFVTLDGEGTPQGSFSDVTLKANYEDLSFGTGQKISFEKEGVGKFRMMLTVTDVWTEATLEEYVTEADRRSAVTTKDAEVINIAPQVSLEPVEMKEAELLFLTEDPGVYKSIQSQTSQVTAILLEHGYDGRVMVEQMLPAETSEDRPWNKTIEVDTPYGYQGSWTPLYEKNNFIADDRRLYKIDATWLGSDKSYYPEPPYTITAWDGETGAVDWTYTFDESVLTVPEDGPYFAQDDSETYLYFVASGKTLVLDKSTG